MWLCRLLGALLLLTLSSCVDHNNFKTCEQSSFCRRLRSIPPGNTPYKLVLGSAQVSQATLAVDLVNKDYNVVFDLRLTAQVDGTYRLTVDEKNPLHPRYKVELMLKAEPKDDKMVLEKVDQETQTITVTNSLRQRVILHAEPFKMEFLDAAGDVAAIINSQGLTTLEHMQERQQNNNNEVEQDENAPEVRKHQDADPGAWEENYKSHHDSKPRGPEALSLDVLFPKATHLYGIPEHADSFALRTTKGQDPYRLYNLDVFEYELQSTMALYGSVPVIYAHGTERTVGLFWVNAAETWVDVQSSLDTDVVSSIVSFVSGSQRAQECWARFMSEAGRLEAFILLGPTPQAAARQYTVLTGTAPLPQTFALGYHQSRWNYNDEEDVRNVDNGFDEHDIPMDVIWLDIEYTNNKKYFTWDSMRFPHPAEMINNMTAKGRKMVLIIDPHIKREPGYFLHDDATDNGYYVKDKDGKDYEGWCWPGSSSYLDFYDPKVSQYYSSRYSFQLFNGTSNDVHIWNDMNEPAVFNGPEVTMPKDNIHYGGWEHRHLHNTYGLTQTMATYKGMLDRAANSRRPFVLTRAHTAGTQRYAAVWTGDNMADWGHLKATIPMCLSLNMAGISFCGADVGGFFRYPESELMTRWYQLGAFQPFYRAHSHIDTKRREPWLYEAATTARIRDAIRRRYSYLPLWYTLFYEHMISGLPVMRPLFMLFPKEKELFAIENEYMIGDSLLVHPVITEGATSIPLVLPGDADQLWYDTDSYIPSKPGKYDIPVTIGSIPVYQRGGAIVSKKERMRRASSLMAHDPYTIIVALNKQKYATGTLYIDDGESFDYLQKKFIYAQLKFEDNILSYSFVDPSATYPTQSWLERVAIAGLGRAPSSATLLAGGRPPVPLELTYHSGNDVLVVRKPEASMADSWRINFVF